MRLGLMQPYFFPYIGYFSLIKQVDQYIVLDEVQYILKGWIDRNRVLKPIGGWQYVKVPTQKHHYKSAIKTVLLNNEFDWQTRFFRQIEHYKKDAPYYNEVLELLEGVLLPKYSTVSELNIASTKAICNYLDIRTPIKVLSKIQLDYETPQKSDEWGLNICKAIPGITEYWNAPGGKDFYDVDKYNRNGIEIKFQKMNLTEYKQKGEQFEPGLSIVDVMMFNSVEEIQQMLDNFELI